MKLYDLTNQESGIILYGGKTVGVFNWSRLEDNELPAVLLDDVVVGDEQEDGYFDGAECTEVDDFRAILPGKFWADDENVETFHTNMNIVYDAWNDLLRCCTTDGNYKARVFTLKSGVRVICPEEFA